MSPIRILFAVGVLFTFVTDARAQGGVRLIFWDVVRFGQNNWATGFGLGYDHDMNERLSLGLQARLFAESRSVWALDYRSAYHLSDNDEASFYIGPQVSVMGYETAGGNATLIPVGMRCGVRGGLERFYADVFVAAHYTLGASAVNDTSRDHTFGSSVIEIGLHMGWGWAKAGR
ncbi:MAG: hypothetical protein JNM62_15500 [Flavobacteriales bacterium]|nr:hypothetical protein [Flavobacteriales bacterium]